MRCYFWIQFYEQSHTSQDVGSKKCVEKPILDVITREINQTTWRWGSRGRRSWGQLKSWKYEF